MKIQLLLFLCFLSFFGYSQCPPNISTNANANRIIFTYPNQAARDAAAAAISSVTCGGVSYPVAAHPGNVTILRVNPPAPNGTFTGIGTGTKTITLSPSGESCTYVDGLLSTAPLPVELLFFKVKEKDKEILLEWSTASETGNDRFEIERSTNKGIFELIGTLKGNGDSYETNNYAYADSGLNSGQYYYRLKQIDFDGEFEYSHVATIDFDSNNDRFGLKSTMVENELQITLSTDNKANATYNVFSYAGQLMQSGIIDSSNSNSNIDINDLEAGFYLLQVNIGREMNTFKFVKM